MAKNEDTEVETDDEGDAPLLDLNDASVLDADAAVADPQFVLGEVFFFRRIMEIDAEVVGQHELHHTHRIGGTG